MKSDGGALPADLNPTERFSDRVADYVRARPRYPDALVELLETEIKLTPPAVIADIGSGTGLSAEPFLRRGHSVYGVEPNAAMRAAAEQVLEQYADFPSTEGSAESTNLPADSVDCIIVAQAFHWFDLDRARDEFQRILRGSGWVVLLWNTRLADGSAFLAAYEALLQQYGTDYDRVAHRTGQLATGERSAGGQLDSFFRGTYERRVLRNAQTLDREGLRSRLKSASYVPAEGTPQHVPMLELLDRLFDEHAVDGTVTFEYHLEIYYGRLS